MHFENRRITFYTNYYTSMCLIKVAGYTARWVTEEAPLVSAASPASQYENKISCSVCLWALEFPTLAGLWNNQQYYENGYGGARYMKFLRVRVRGNLFKLNSKLSLLILEFKSRSNKKTWECALAKNVHHIWERSNLGYFVVVFMGRYPTESVAMSEQGFTTMFFLKFRQLRDI